MRLGEVMRKFRVMSELSQRDLAEQIGLNVSTICRIENGEGMDGKTLAKVLVWLTEEAANV